MKKALFIMRYFLRKEGDNRKDYHPKFDDQISAVTNLGYSCVYIALDDGGNVYRIENEKRSILTKIPFHSIPLIHQFAEYTTIYNMAKKIVQEEEFDFVYVRNAPMVPNYSSMMKVLKKNCRNVVVEIPTFPSSQEVSKEKRLWIKAIYPFMNYIEKKSAKSVTLYTLIGLPANEFHGVPAINIYNGTNINGYSKHIARKKDGAVHMIALAGMAHYHGYDRVIMGMANYYQSVEASAHPFYLHLVGPDADGSLEKWMALVKELNLDKYVIREGAMNGSLLDDMFNKCDIGCGAMAGFRRSTHVDFDLKNAEYLSRGIPFICCQFSDSFEYNIPHCYSDIKECDDPIDINKIVNFALKEIDEENVADQMREFASELSWKSQFQKVIQKLGTINGSVGAQ